MAKDGKIKIDEFDGHDFGFWKIQIEDYLYEKKLHEPLAEAKPTGMKAEDWTLLDRQAMGAVMLSLAKNIAYNFVNEKTAYGLLKALSNIYEKHDVSNKKTKAGAESKTEGRSRTEVDQNQRSESVEEQTGYTDEYLAFGIAFGDNTKPKGRLQTASQDTRERRTIHPTTVRSQEFPRRCQLATKTHSKI
ncbi:hypothetical protein Tco_0923516 [Tanacetum coccineum]|uniref:Retrovirus-related Pol polyprotein from transposon TNT 1-94 n=1 Tax=Tanacetum coccineum TaxID=301880 RepID=A0ABQ5D2P3_9ASTR